MNICNISQKIILVFIAICISAAASAEDLASDHISIQSVTDAYVGSINFAAGKFGPDGKRYLALFYKGATFRYSQQDDDTPGSPMSLETATPQQVVDFNNSLYIKGNETRLYDIISRQVLSFGDTVISCIVLNLYVNPDRVLQGQGVTKIMRWRYSGSDINVPVKFGDRSVICLDLFKSNDKWFITNGTFSTSQYVRGIYRSRR